MYRAMVFMVLVTIISGNTNAGSIQGEAYVIKGDGAIATGAGRKISLYDISNINNNGQTNIINFLQGKEVSSFSPQDYKSLIDLKSKIKSLQKKKQKAAVNLKRGKKTEIQLTKKISELEQSLHQFRDENGKIRYEVETPYFTINFYDLDAEISGDLLVFLPDNGKNSYIELFSVNAGKRIASIRLKPNVSFASFFSDHGARIYLTGDVPNNVAIISDALNAKQKLTLPFEDKGSIFLLSPDLSKVLMVVMKSGYFVADVNRNNWSVSNVKRIDFPSLKSLSSWNWVNGSTIRC